MKRCFHSLAAHVLTLTVLLPPSGQCDDSQVLESGEIRKPNIILINADDLGYADYRTGQFGKLEAGIPMAPGMMTKHGWHFIGPHAAEPTGSTIFTEVFLLGVSAR